MHKYNPDSYYLQNKAEENIKIVTPKAQFWSGHKRSSSLPSPILSWYLQENAKRRKNDFNEIDLNEMVASSHGFKNKWSKIVIENKKFSEDFFKVCRTDEKPLIEKFWLEILILKKDCETG